MSMGFSRDFQHRPLCLLSPVASHPSLPIPELSPKHLLLVPPVGAGPRDTGHGLSHRLSHVLVLWLGWGIHDSLMPTQWKGSLAPFSEEQRGRGAGRQGDGQGQLWGGSGGCSS